mmetsp:Transcript_45304/g.125716  ORF Transcript_45304/g.125716 Transcript_45304/m.125716 type:complete len:218 (+) Transcript_45304:221-874(+)
MLWKICSFASSENGGGSCVHQASAMAAPNIVRYLPSQDTRSSCLWQWRNADAQNVGASWRKCAAASTMPTIALFVTRPITEAQWSKTGPRNSGVARKPGKWASERIVSFMSEFDMLWTTRGKLYSTHAIKSGGATCRRMAKACTMLGKWFPGTGLPPWHCRHSAAATASDSLASRSRRRPWAFASMARFWVLNLSMAPRVGPRNAAKSSACGKENRP